MSYKSVLLVGPLVLLAFATCCLDAQELSQQHRNFSGVYPHLTAYGIYSQNGAHLKPGHEECGIGAVVPWADKLWMVTYAPHRPGGSEHKLYSIDSDLNPTIHPDSVGGTPAGRMIHDESEQLLISHYVISKEGSVRTIPIEQMPIRVTAITRHLIDPENMVYYVDMEGSIWEANVHTLKVSRLFKKPVPGWHGKGAYVSQGRLVVSNNGELHAGSYNDLLVGGPAKDEEERGVLAEFDGKSWRVIERRQYTEVTGPSGIKGGGTDEPIWSIGWDRRSLRLKVLDDGIWQTYLLPKAAFCNDAYHGWYTEWPRIREITDGKWMLDMHGMFFDFPKTFSASNSKGIRPIGSHLRYIPDFCSWNGKLVLGTDETSIQGNDLAGQPQSNLWFGDFEDLKSWGPASAYGGPWISDPVEKGVSSLPYLVAGFDRQVLHLAVNDKPFGSKSSILRTSDQQEVLDFPDRFAALIRVTTSRGNWKSSAHGFQFTLNEPATVYLVVDQRGYPSIDPQWEPTDMSLTWGQSHHVDKIYKREFPAGTVDIPSNVTEHLPGSFGMPHMVFIEGASDRIDVDSQVADVHYPATNVSTSTPSEPVVFTIEVDREGNGQWDELKRVEVQSNGYVCEYLPESLNSTWLRLIPNRDAIATAVLHQTTKKYNDPLAYRDMFASLANVGDKQAIGGLLYPSKTSRNLVVVSPRGTQYELTKEDFKFKNVSADNELAELIAVEPEFEVDKASVILHHKGKRLRLPKGHTAFDAGLSFGWPRGSREVQSERHLANIHGTFYEVPLILNGQPPAFELMRPVASHSKQIHDFCSWNGLLAVTGISNGDGKFENVFQRKGDQFDDRVGIWCGGIDDLWKLGKPVGVGGPWFQTKVKSHVPSDPYLMTGYDKKTLTLRSDHDAVFKVEIDVDHLSGWYEFASLKVEAGVDLSYVFPPSFSAHWVRLVSSDDCMATAEFLYE